MRLNSHTAGLSGESYFWSQVVKNQAGDCWIWQGNANKGYGVASWQGKKWRAHRLAYLLLWGSIPEGKHLDHLCRNTLCVYPWHLEPVTPAENDRRKVIRRRELPSAAPAHHDNHQVERRAAWYDSWLRGFHGCQGLKATP